MSSTVAVVLVVIGLLSMHGVDANAADHWIPGGHVRLHIDPVHAPLVTLPPAVVARTGSRSRCTVCMAALRTVSRAFAPLVPVTVASVSSRSTSVVTGPEAPPP